MNLSLSLTDNLGISRSSGVVDNGVAIVNHAKTTVAATSGDGYTVERTTGGGAWDASAISTSSITGDCAAVIHHLVGDVATGISQAADLGSSDSYDFPGIKLIWLGGQLYVYASGGQVGAARTLKQWGKVEYTAGDDTIRVYTSDDGASWGAAIETFSAVGASTWGFDSSLNTASAQFTAKFS